jgi:cytochrome c
MAAVRTSSQVPATFHARLTRPNLISDQDATSFAGYLTDRDRRDANSDQLQALESKSPAPFLKDDLYDALQYKATALPDFIWSTESDSTHYRFSNAFRNEAVILNANTHKTT